MCQKKRSLDSSMFKRLRRSIFYGFPILVGATLIGLYAYGGTYGINVVLRRGMSIWRPISDDDTRISNSMRLALRGSLPPVVAGKPEWRLVAKGFEVAELPVFAERSMVDQILLARIDPALYRFQVHNAPAGNRDLGNWMKETGAVLVINGSYYASRGTPDTPIMSQGRLLGVREYTSRHGAFVASASSAAVVDLSQQDWRKAFAVATDALVSYPLLIAADGTTRVKGDARWLANRSFIGQDEAGRIVVGTTTDAFFSLERLAAFLQRAALGLKLALNLDGGPVACQGISIGDFHRDFCGQWEIAVHNGQLELLTPLIGRRRFAMPIILAVLPK
jgi:hypothetical protein